MNLNNKVIFFIMVFCLLNSSVYSQQNFEWTKIRIANLTHYPIYNLNIHYNKGVDSSWIIREFKERGQLLNPGESLTIEVVSNEIAVYSYAFDFNYAGIEYHKSVNQLQVFKSGIPNNLVIANFVVQKPWWKSWWYYTLLVLIILLMTYLSFKYYHYFKLRTRNLQLEKTLALQQERARISSEMHDDIGSGLFGIKMLTEVYGEKTKDAEARQNFNDVQNEINNISNKVREVIWSIDPKNDTLSNLIAFINKQAEKMYSNTEIKLEIVVNNKIPLFTVDAEIRRNVYLLMKEGLHNVIKHSKAQRVTIHYSFDRMINILIEDDGIGFKQQLSYSGHGIYNMRERIRKLKGNLIFNSTSFGTTIKILIPYNGTNI